VKGTLAVILLVIGSGVAMAAAAAPRIPSSEAPGRERERFVDPPGARLLQPTEPSTVLPYGTGRPAIDCPPRTRHGKRVRRSCRPVR
jgi:hypothetical protein